MAFYDLEEQEQLAALKSWWKQWGALVITGIAVAFASLAGLQIWSWYTDSQARKASDLYAAISKSIRDGNPQKARDTVKELVEAHPKSGYAPLAGLIAARLAFDAGDSASAKQQLQWVIDKARDSDMKGIARLRLAGVLLDEKQYDEALKLLDAKPEDPMIHLLADLRGDTLVAKGASIEARAAYQLAIEKTDTKSPYRNLIQIKIDALGPVK